MLSGVPAAVAIRDRVAASKPFAERARDHVPADRLLPHESRLPRGGLAARRGSVAGDRRAHVARADGGARSGDARPARRDRRDPKRAGRLGRSADDQRPVPARAEAAVHAGPRVRGRWSRGPGPRSRTSRVGDRVLVDGFLAGPRSLGAYQAYGGFASYGVAPRRGGARRSPATLSFDQACNLLGNYETAYHCLVTRGQLQRRRDGADPRRVGLDRARRGARREARSAPRVIATGRSRGKLAVVPRRAPITSIDAAAWLACATR